MANQEFTPELNDAVYQAILRKLKEEQEQQLAQASGEAMRRGLSGSNYEARRQGDANRAYQTSSADALVNLNVENATRLREERLRKEEQDFTVGRDSAQRQWQELENNKQRAFELGNMQLAQQFEAQQNEINRAWEEKQNSRQQRADLISTGLGSVANVGSSLLGMKMASGLLGKGAATGATGATQGSMASLFGSGTAGVMPSTAAPAAAGGGLGAAGALGIGALGVGAQIGQSLFARKNLGVTNKESQLLSFIPGGATQLGVVKKGAAAVKSLFCFHPDVKIEMLDGRTKRIKDVLIGDETKGGRVESIRLSLTAPGTLCNYKGILVTDSHAVKDVDGIWKRVGDCEGIERINEESYVVSLVTSNHRIFVNGIEFADEFENDEYEHLNLEQSLAALNGEAA